MPNTINSAADQGSRWLGVQAAIIERKAGLSEFIEALGGSEPLEWNPRSIGKMSREPTLRAWVSGLLPARRSPENSGIADYFAARKIPFEAECACGNMGLYEKFSLRTA